MNITNTKGFTLLELVITATVLLILASASVPLVKNGIRRDKELELSRNLREIRLVMNTEKLQNFKKLNLLLQKIICAPQLSKNSWKA